MTVIGIGVDVVGLERFERQLAGTPGLRERLFAPSERALPTRSLAARFAAKEALIKTLGRDDGISFAQVAVENDELGRPYFVLGQEASAAVASRGIRTLHLSISHDAGFACAFVVGEGEPVSGESAIGHLLSSALPDERNLTGGVPWPNGQAATATEQIQSEPVQDDGRIG